MLSPADIARFRQDGFLFLKGVLGADEVARFKDIARQLPKRSMDLSAVPDLESFWSDPRLVTVAKQLLGDPVTFFCEASVQRENFELGEDIRGRHLHHDAKGTPEHLFNRQHAPTKDPYPIIRFAIYLQDHATFSGGLKLVPGSHQMDSSDIKEEEFSYLNVPSVPGDVVVFCNKILHSPYALRPADSPETALSPREEDRVFVEHPDAFLPPPQDRDVIFIDFAGSNELADIYIKGRALYPTNVKQGIVDAVERGRLIEDAARAGVRLRLDAGIAEALRSLAAASAGGKVGKAAMRYLTALPALCRLSAPWSQHFNFVPDVPEGAPPNPLELANKLAPRMNELATMVATQRKDAAMNLYRSMKKGVQAM